MKVAIVTPTFNEDDRAIKLIHEIRKVSPLPIIIVDDGSKVPLQKQFGMKLKKLDNIEIITHAINIGKGAAMITGAEKAWELGFDAVIFIDSDGQHNPNSIKYFDKEIKKYPIVFGHRKFSDSMPAIRRIGNILAIMIISTLFDIKRKDLLCGFMAIRKDAYKKVLWSENRYGVETEIATKVAKNKIPFSEVEIDTIYVDKYKGVTIIDAIKIFFKIPIWYFARS